MPKNGFTLVEIIASIVLLGVVIIAFLPIFPQMFIWSNSAEKELVASNLTAKVAQDIFENDEIAEKGSSLSPSISCELSEYQSLEGVTLTYPPLNDVNYTVELKACHTQKEKELGLTRVYFRITNDQNNRAVDSYAYAQREEE